VAYFAFNVSMPIGLSAIPLISTKRTAKRS